jgi:hypothetical protein
MGKAQLNPSLCRAQCPEAESKEKHGVWDPMPELLEPHLMCTPESAPTHLPWPRGQPYARVDFIPQSGTLDLASVIVKNLKLS